MQTYDRWSEFFPLSLSHFSRDLVESFVAKIVPTLISGVRLRCTQYIHSIDSFMVRLVASQFSQILISFETVASPIDFSISLRHFDEIIIIINKKSSIVYYLAITCFIHTK